MAREWAALADDAYKASAEEHSMGFFTAVKRYPKACIWSMAVSLIIIMDGYDTALIGSLFGSPAFQKRFGHEVGNSGKYQLEAQWQVALGLASNIGNVMGVGMNGILTEKLGHKKVVLVSLALLCGFIFISFFAQSVQALFLGQILCGLPWGVFTTLAPAYASEVTPVVLRGHLETFVVTCWGIGQFLSYAVLFSLNTSKSTWSYRIPFAVQWVWPVIIIPLLSFAPESPWWLVRKGRIAEAEKSVLRLTSSENLTPPKRQPRTPWL
jgi:SP family general alpha glucoside:H+ symporter-like MFS transporter